MKRVDVKEFARMTGRSTREVVNLCKKGKLPFEKSKKNGKDRYVINIECKEAFEMVKNTKKDKKNNQKYKKTATLVKSSELSGDNRDNHLYIELNKNPELVNTLVQQVKETQKLFCDIQDELITFSEAAGQAKVLSISEKLTRQQYFELTQENKMLVEQQLQLKTQLDQKKSEIEELQQQLQQLESANINKLLRKF